MKKRFKSLDSCEVTTDDHNRECADVNAVDDSRKPKVNKKVKEVLVSDMSEIGGKGNVKDAKLSKRRLKTKGCKDDVVYGSWRAKKHKQVETIDHKQVAELEEILFGTDSVAIYDLQNTRPNGSEDLSEISAALKSVDAKEANQIPRRPSPNAPWLEIAKYRKATSKLKRRNDSSFYGADTTADELDNTASLENDLASSSDEEGTDYVNPIRCTTNKIIASKQVLDTITPHKILVRRLEDVNRNHQHRSRISTVQFDRNSNLLMTASPDRMCCLYQMNHESEKVKLLQSLNIDQYNIQHAVFTADSENILLLASKSISQYNLTTGSIWKLPDLYPRGGSAVSRNDINTKNRFQYKKLLAAPHPSDSSHFTQSDIYALSCSGGSIGLISAKSSSLVRTIQLNGEVADMTFHPYNNSIIAGDKEGTVYQWDIGTGRCIQTMTCDSCSSLSSMAVTPVTSIAAAHATSSNRSKVADQYAPSGIDTHCRLVMGTTSGFVDVLPLTQPLTTKVEKSLKNLKTPATLLKFHPFGEIMFMASDAVADSCRLVHMPSLTVYDTWPAQSDKFGNITAADFSRQGGYFACGNNKGLVQLYKIPSLAKCSF